MCPKALTGAKKVDSTESSLNTGATFHSNEQRAFKSKNRQREITIRKRGKNKVSHSFYIVLTTTEAQEMI